MPQVYLPEARLQNMGQKAISASTRIYCSLTHIIPGQYKEILSARTYLIRYVCMDQGKNVSNSRDANSQAMFVALGILSPYLPPHLTNKNRQ